MVRSYFNYLLDYSPYGTVQNGRKDGSGYRYGFKGMESDDEVKGTKNSYTTEFRQYDPRIGRWLSIDPEFANFPWQSPYAAFDNNPILNNDPKGRAAEKTNGNPKEKLDRLQDKVDKLKDKKFNTPLKKELKRELLQRRIDRLENKIRAMAQIHSKLGPGTEDASNHGRGGGESVPGNGPGNSESILPNDVAPRETTLGYRAVRQGAGGTEVLEIGQPAGPGASDPFAPVWSAKGVAIFAGTPFVINIGDPVNVGSNGEVYDNNGTQMLPGIKGVNQLSSILKPGETITKVNKSGSVMSTSGIVNSISIVNFFTKYTYTTSGLILKEEPIDKIINP